jgi:hypothetical protein
MIVMRAHAGVGPFTAPISALLAAFVAGGIFLLVGSAHAEDGAQETAQETTEAKTPRAAIKFADHGGINDWRATDRDTLYVEGRHGEWFKATFMGTCAGLRFTETIGFETEANGDLDSFSAVIVDGRRCAFRTFERVDGLPKKDVAEKDEAKQDSDE